MNTVSALTGTHPVGQYVGRFAPSPSGPLHFGSLIAALGSYLRARSQQGKWLVRIEDLDPPREVAGAADAILRTLEAHGLHWDDSVLYQSQRSERYEQILTELVQQGQCYPCHCTRKRVQSLGGVYDGHCRRHPPTDRNGALRLHNQVAIAQFDDILLGQISTTPEFAAEDYLLKRRDGLYAYQLAVVVDDHDQGMTEIVRGNDLLEATVRQLTLYRQLNWQAPQFLHLPLAVWADGNKLSKQNHAPAIDDQQALNNLLLALQFLGQPQQAHWPHSTIEQVLVEACAQFELTHLPQVRSLPAPRERLII